MYYNATYREYYLAQEGYWEKDKMHQLYLRRQTHLIRLALIGNEETDPVNYWPVLEDEVPESGEEKRERMIRERDEILEKVLARDKAKKGILEA